VRLLLGMIFMAVGGGIMLFGMFLALRELGGLYQGVIDDPLGQPEGAEDDVQQGMIRGVIVGGVGVLPFIIGSVMVKGAIARKISRAARGR
jgi:hypothetical protein